MQVLSRRLDEVYGIGDGVGANRVGGTLEEDQACDLVAGWMAEAGLELERDDRGNVVGRLVGARPDLPEVWTGSHLDSVPEGGRLDGPLGVLAGLEAVSAVGRSERTLGVVVFRDEETGCHGSRWRVRNGSLPGSYVELHIEQGPRLERAGAPLGVVTGIVAYARRNVSFTGAAGHAGTKPMDARDDALVKASEYVLRVRDAAAAIDGAVGTVGVLEVLPGGVNVIPGAVNLTVDARAPDDERLKRLLSDLGLEAEPIVPAAPWASRCAASSARRWSEWERRWSSCPRGRATMQGVLAAAGVEAGMLFVRSLNGGVSHSPDEHSSDEDIALAVDVLTTTLRRLAEAK